LRGEAIAPSHAGVFVDDDDVLAIEAYDLDNIPHVEVIAADSETAVHTGITMRNYVRPRQIPGEGVRITRGKLALPPLTSAVKAHPPQFISNQAVPISEHTELVFESN
jgi:hypothetical protein